MEKKKILKGLIILLFSITFLNLNTLGSPHFDLNQNCRNAYDNILSLRFEIGKEILEKERKSNPENLVVDVIEHYIFFLKAFITEDQKELDTLQNRRNEHLVKLENFSGESPFKNWAIANVHLQSAFARLKFDEKYTAALEIRKAYQLLEANQNKYPDFLPNQLGLGLLYALVGSIPSQYQWVLKLVSMKGSVQQGSDMLYNVLKMSDQKQYFTYLRSESLFFLSFIEMNLKVEKNDAEKLLKEFRVSDNDNLLLIYAKANLEMRLGKNDASMNTLSNRPESPDYFHFYYLDFLYGETLLRKLDVSALKHYDKFIKYSQGRNYHVDAIRKVGWIYLIQGDEVTYKKTMRDVLATNKGYSESDFQAYREAEKEQEPNMGLLKSRLLFDGGYYTQSKALILGLFPAIETLSYDEKIEFYYRLGRIEHALENNTNALLYYQSAISIGKSSPMYYAASAALRSGEIYETESRISEARKMYNLCLSLNPEEYKKGLHFRAKAGLSRLSAK